MSTSIHVRETASRCGQFEARLDDGTILVASSTTPFFDACRVLLARGADPAATAVMVRPNGTHSLTATIGEAARLTVENTRFVPEHSAKPTVPVTR